MIRFVLFTFFVLVVQSGMTQGSSLSQDDLLKSYLESRESARQSSSKGFSAEEQAELDRLESLLKENYPDSYGTHLVIWLNGRYNTDRKTNLFRAYELDPDTKEIRNEMLAYYTITGDLAKQKEFAGLIKSQYSANTLNYYRDLLPESGILVTSNQSDSYPLYVLQSVYTEGQGVQVINLEFLQNPVYKSRMQKEAVIGNTVFTGSEKVWLSTLISSSTKDVRISATVNQGYFDMTESMYLTGLGYEYNPRNQYDLLDAFWNSVKGRNLAAVQLTSAEKKIYGNYLPALLTFYKLKLTGGTEDPLLRSGIAALAEKISKSETVDEILENYETNR